MKERYFITIFGESEMEVTKEEYVQHERAAGFHNTLGQPDEPATSAFNNGYDRGRIKYGE